MSQQASERLRPDVVAARAVWAARRLHVPAARLVFVDETWATTNMAPRYGRSPRGQRCVGHAPHGRWHTTTFVAGLRAAGLIAPFVLDGAINGAAFRVWIERVLVRELRPGDVVVMDNLGSHKVGGVRQAIEAAGASLLLPAALQPRPQPHRAGVRQAQGAAATSRRAHP